MFPEETWVMGFVIGAFIGSFLNVVIYRLPRRMSLSKPANSFCPTCERRLSVSELIPLLSWLIQGGKCKGCRSRIPARYFFVELTNAALWGGIWYVTMCRDDDWIKGIAWMLFGAALVAAIFTDLMHYIIPDEVNAFMLFVGIALNVVQIILGMPEAWIGFLPSSLVGAFVGTGVLWGIAFLGRVLFRKDAMGHGDIKMARGIGAVLLPMGALISFGLAIVLGAVIGVLIIVIRNAVQRGKGGDEEADGEEEIYEPETIKSLVLCGIGYFLAIDVIGLFQPKLYEAWFGEDPYAVEEIDDTAGVELTMIPFGPYLAAGAIGVMLFEPALKGLVQSYFQSLSL
jgi:leader peptidase (prepilin peptidase)/N-methyltransferase